MEVALGRSDHESRIKEAKTTESGGPGDADHPKQEINIEVPPVNDTCGPIVSSAEKEEVEKLESAKTEMGEVREENQRLKQCLDRVMKDYRTLEMKFQHIFQKETKHQSTSTCSEPDDLVSLSLGRVICSNNNNNNARTNEDDHQKSKALLKALLLKDNNNSGGEEEDLALGLDCKFETSKSGSITTDNNNSSPNIINPSPTNSSHQEPVINNESKALKTSRDSYSGEDEVSQHNPPKRARVCVKARCDAPTMNDGCHWRKYGQKISKGNPCPRAYYRCTAAPPCPVKKQVQRCAEDMSVLVTTYEGIHNHPLPLSATAIASTTSAAASMLLSASSSSSSAVAAATATIPSLYFSNNPSSLSSSSSLPSHPTVTLDLTTNSAASRFFMTSSSSSSNYNPPPRSSSFPSSTSLNFSSPNNNNFLSYNSNNRNHFSSMNLARSTTVDNNIYRLPYVQRNSVINNPTHHHHPPPPQPAALPDSIADATKAIAADPKFQSALAVALSSIIGTGGSGIGSSSQGQGNRGGAGENLPQKVKWGELFPAL